MAPGQENVGVKYFILWRKDERHRNYPYASVNGSKCEQYSIKPRGGGINACYVSNASQALSYLIHQITQWSRYSMPTFHLKMCSRDVGLS